VQHNAMAAAGVEVAALAWLCVFVVCVCVIWFVRAGSPANLNFKWVGDGGHDFS
jgi:hypothetical protein